MIAGAGAGIGWEFWEAGGSCRRNASGDRDSCLWDADSAAADSPPADSPAGRGGDVTSADSRPPMNVTGVGGITIPLSASGVGMLLSKLPEGFLSEALVWLLLLETGEEDAGQGLGGAGALKGDDAMLGE